MAKPVVTATEKNGKTLYSVSFNGKTKTRNSKVNDYKYVVVIELNNYDRDENRQFVELGTTDLRVSYHKTLKDADKALRSWGQQNENTRKKMNIEESHPEFNHINSIQIVKINEETKQDEKHEMAIRGLEMSIKRAKEEGNFKGAELLEETLKRTIEKEKDQ
ncbi:hypothetical protein MOF23_22665 [Bacillus inaquosorum]|uniref:hypothetical protein n=1 Tax=Bacillus inaquosorum TaxID=483913 RepID=UPI00227FE734|nr:hypothetical protein [Bacillus inaquosorum]MCY9311739.1 hypothetical protein [Bacillus inaquosorum]